MTFVINAAITQDDLLNDKNWVYDPEGTNYIFQKSSGIIDGIKYLKEKFYSHRILQKLKQTDPEAIGLINYSYKTVTKQMNKSIKESDGFVVNSILEEAFKQNLYINIEEILNDLSMSKMMNPDGFQYKILKCLLYKNIVKFLNNFEIENEVL
jgi:hypothetical protein